MGMREGVPPPIYNEEEREELGDRDEELGSRVLASWISAEMKECQSARLAPTEKKSQYRHLRRQNGIWMYMPSIASAKIIKKRERVGILAKCFKKWVVVGGIVVEIGLRVRKMPLKVLKIQKYVL